MTFKEFLSEAISNNLKDVLKILQSAGHNAKAKGSQITITDMGKDISMVEDVLFKTLESYNLVKDEDSSTNSKSILEGNGIIVVIELSRGKLTVAVRG